MASSKGCGRVGRRGQAWCRSSGVLGVLALLCGACDEPEPLAFEHAVYEVRDEGETLISTSCDELPESELDGSFGFGFGTAPGLDHAPYMVNYDFEAERVLFRVAPSPADPALAEREYDEAFLSSGTVDDFNLELEQGFALHFIHQGAWGCPGPGRVP